MKTWDFGKILKFILKFSSQDWCLAQRLICRLGHPQPRPQVLGLCPGSAPDSKVLVGHTLGCSRWEQLMYVAPWHPHGKPKLNSGILTSACGRHLETKSGHGRSILSLSSLSLNLIFKQINPSFTKNLKKFSQLDTS